MKSLDELLSERAQREYQDALTQVLDPAGWTEENRDSKLLEIRTLAEGVCDISEAFVVELLEKKINERSILWHKVREQFIVGEIQLLTGFRDELDISEQVSTLPITYEWLNEQIRIRYQELATINQAVQETVQEEPGVEEL